MSRENPGECECCQFETKELTLFKDQDTKIAGGGKLIKADFWFCDLCAGSMASTHYRYLNEDRTTLSTICNVGNQILAKLKVKP